MVAIAERRAQEQQLKNENILTNLVESLVMLEGRKRRGKTMTGVALCYNLRNTFGMNIITIGSKMGLNEKFGPFQCLDEREFINQLERITAITKGTSDADLQESIDVILEKLGITIYGSVLVFDEAQKFFDARTPHDKLVRVFGQFIAQMAHYHATIILMTPHRDMIDKRVRRQVDWYGRVSYLKRKQTVVVRFRQGLVDTFKLKVYGPNYWDMYDSWTLLGYRSKDINIQGL